MKSYNSSKLLAQAEFFLDRTFKSSVRWWAVGSLISLAENEQVPLEQRPTDLVVDPKTSLYPEFRKKLIYVAGLAPNDEWEHWLRTNASVLGNLPSQEWNTGPGYTYIFTESESPSYNNYIQTFICESNVAPKTIDVSSSSYLRPVGRIPPLWMFSGVYVGEPSQPLSKHVAHYDWVVQSIGGITGDRFDNDWPAKAEAFAVGNRKKLDSIRKWFSFEPKKLGGGSDGVAWDIGNRRILKIFSDRIAYDHALQAIDRIHSNPSLGKNEAMIYDVGEIGYYGTTPIFYYIMERMAPVTDIYGISDYLRPLVSAIVSKIYKDRNFWRAVKSKDFKSQGKEIQAEVKKAAKRYAEELEEKEGGKIRALERQYDDEQVKVDSANPEEHVVPLSDNWLAALAEEVLVKYLTGRTDLHMGNLGVTAYGEFRYFDPAFEGWTSNVNMGGGLVPKPEASNMDWTD